MTIIVMGHLTAYTEIFHVFEKMLKAYRYLIETTTAEYYKTLD